MPPNAAPSLPPMEPHGPHVDKDGAPPHLRVTRTVMGWVDSNVDKVYIVDCHGVLVLSW